MLCSLSIAIAAPASICGFTVFGSPRHDVIDRGLGQVAVQIARQVAVRDDADQPPLAVDDADAAETLPRQHHASPRASSCRAARQRHLVARCA